MKPYTHTVVLILIGSFVGFGVAGLIGDPIMSLILFMNTIITLVLVKLVFMLFNYKLIKEIK